MALKFIITSTGMQFAIPTGIIVYKIILTTPLKIVPGYVAKLIIILVNESASMSPFVSQKHKLPAILATDVNIIAPVIENKVNNDLFAEYYAQAEMLVSEVITLKNIFLGCTKKLSSFPFIIRSGISYVL